MVVKDEHSIFASLYKNSDLTEALDESFGLLYHYEQYCIEKCREDPKYINEANTWKLIRALF